VPITPDVSTFSAAILQAAEKVEVGVGISFFEDDGSLRPAFMNDAGAAVFGYTRAEIMTLRAEDLLPAGNRAEQIDRARRRAAGEAVPNWYTTTARGRDREFPIQVSTTPILIDGRRALVSFFIDVSDRVRATEELARSEERFRILVEHAPDAVWIVDRGALAYVNPATVRMLGYPDAEAVRALQPVNLVHPDEREMLVSRSRALLEDRAEPGPRDYKTYRADGTTIVVEVHSIPIEWQGRRALLAFGRDVTARKEMEARLAHNERLTALGTMVAGVAHEINNPLAFATLALDHALAALEVGGDAPSARARLLDVKQGLDRIAGIVRDLRGFAQPQGEQRACVDLADVAATALHMLARDLERANVVTKLEAGAYVSGSAARLEQVFSNLLGNAAQAIAAAPEERGRVVVSVARSGDRVVATVEDDGVGMPPEVVARAFEPYATTKVDGLGLGLSITRRIVEAHGGTISVESTPGVGTHFALSFPVWAERAPETGVRRRVLVIDDEPTLLASMERILVLAYEVQTANCVADAMRILDEHSFDALLCDVMMPSRTGVDLHEELSRTRPEVAARMVFMTGGGYDERIAALLSRSGVPLLEKPFGPNLLFEALEGAMRSRPPVR